MRWLVNHAHLHSLKEAPPLGLASTLGCICGHHHVALQLGRRHYWFVLSFFASGCRHLSVASQCWAARGCGAVAVNFVWTGAAHPSGKSLPRCLTPGSAEVEFSQDTRRRLCNLERILTHLLQADKSIMLLCPFIDAFACKADEEITDRSLTFSLVPV